MARQLQKQPQRPAKVSDLVISRTFDSPRECVWKAWTDAEQVKRWWGPKGFLTRFAQIDLQVGGTSLYCTRSPEGNDYWSTGTFREIIPFERIVVTDSFTDEKGDVIPASYYGMPGDNWPLELLVTLTFSNARGRTKLTLRHAGFHSADVQVQAGAGWKESFDKLKAYLSMTMGKKSLRKRGKTQFSMPSDREIIMTRSFNAPREKVFRIYTDPAMIPQFWGPERFTTTVETMDVKQGGKWRYVQRDAAGNEYAFRGEYLEVAPPEKLVSLFEFEGMAGHVSVETMTLTERNCRTTISNTSTFESKEDRDGMIEAGMEEGSAEMMDRLAKLVEGD